MGFVGRPNKALANMGLKDQTWSHFWEESKLWRAKEEEEKRKKEDSSQDQAKVWNLDFWYENQP